MSGLRAPAHLVQLAELAELFLHLPLKCPLVKVWTFWSMIRRQSCFCLPRSGDRAG